MQRPWHSKVNPLFNKSAPKRCMAGFLCRKAIRSHVISRGRVLNKIAEAGEVVSIVPAAEFADRVTFSRQGVMSTAIFSGFCAKHDQALFAPIDNSDYVPGDQKQEFFFAYRSIANYFWLALVERYMAERYDAVVSQDAEEFFADPGAARRDYREKAELFAKQADTWRDIKDSVNRQIAHRQYDTMRSITIELPGEYPVAFSGVIFVGHGRLESLGETEDVEPMPATLNLFPQNGRTLAVLTCLNAHDLQCLEYMLGGIVAKIGSENYRVVLSNLICGASEAIAIKPSYWDRIPDSTKTAFTQRWRAAVLRNLPDIDPTLDIFIEDLIHEGA